MWPFVATVADNGLWFIAMRMINIGKTPWSYYTYSFVHELKGFLFQVPVVHMHLELTNMQMNNQIWENPLKKFHLLNNAYDSQKTIALLLYLIEW